MTPPLPPQLHAQPDPRLQLHLQPHLQLLHGLPHPAWVAELASGRMLAVNDAAHRLFGGAAGELMARRADTLLTSPEDLLWWAAASAHPHEPMHALYSDTVVAAADGRSLQVSRSIQLLPPSDEPAPSTGPGNAPARQLLVMLIDRSAEHEAEQSREALVSELQATLEATADGILVTDLRGRVRTFNRRFATLWDLPLALLQSEDQVALQAWMEGQIADIGDGAGAAAYRERLADLQLHPQDGASDRILLLGGTVLERVAKPLVRGGCMRGWVWSFRDLSEQLAARQRIDTLARQDLLTGLANRSALAEQVALQFAELANGAVAGGRGGGAPGFALMVVDLDHFAHINDSLGQACGDQVLREVARRIQASLRQHDVLARLGGDQFAILVCGTGAEGAEAAARRVLKVVAEPYRLDAVAFSLTCSLGVALAPSHGRSLDELVRHAEAAVRAAKSQGRASYRVHQVRQVRQGTDLQANMALDHAMRQALVSGRFRLHYQPQVQMSDGQVIGAEALLRWRDPELGEISPGRFIPVAEASGFIVDIGDWVLSQAVRQAVLWHQRGLSLPIAVNVSALQFQQSQFVERVAGVLAISGLPPHLLELELTESILVMDAEEALQRLQALSRLGLKLSIDDFGTGYSSLAYLKRFPISKLKIDRSFIKGLPDDESDVGIVNAVLQMARALRMKVVAEGVETEAQRSFLQAGGCDQFQGFLYAPALDPMSFVQRLQHGAPAATASQRPVRKADKLALTLVQG